MNEKRNDWRECVPGVGVGGGGGGGGVHWKKGGERLSEGRRGVRDRRRR